MSELIRLLIQPCFLFLGLPRNSGHWKQRAQSSMQLNPHKSHCFRWNLNLLNCRIDCAQFCIILSLHINTYTKMDQKHISVHCHWYGSLRFCLDPGEQWGLLINMCGGLSIVKIHGSAINFWSSLPLLPGVFLQGLMLLTPARVSKSRVKVMPSPNKLYCNPCSERHGLSQKLCVI